MDKWLSKLRTHDDCIAFVDDVGFCTIDAAERFPQFPNQADAMGVESAIGQTWFWKDDLHIAKRLYYTRLFFARPGYISIGLLPAFIATNGEAPDELILMGRMPPAQRAVYDIIDQYGPISTRDLKKMLSVDGKRQASGALIALERLFITTKVGITGRTLSTYSYIWDLAERWASWAFEEADALGAKRAREIIVSKLRQNGLEPTAELLLMGFGWE